MLFPCPAPRSLAVETDRLNLEVANRAMEEEARLARKETDLLLTAAAILVRSFAQLVAVIPSLRVSRRPAARHC